MVEIAGRKIDTVVDLRDEEVSVFAPGLTLTEDDILEIRNAKEIREYATTAAGDENLTKMYNLIVWKSVENVGGSIRFRWQTYRTTDINQLKQDNEDLTQAVLELAQIVGGDNG